MAGGEAGGGIIQHVGATPDQHQIGAEFGIAAGDGEAKAGVLAMIRSLAVEWGPHGIRLNGIAPGPFPTEGAFGRLRPAGTEMPPPEAGVALGRTGKPAELADLAAFLVSDGAGYITGEVLAIDGGRRLEGAAGPDLAALRGWTPAVWDSLRGVGRAAAPASADEAIPAIKDRS